jgi:hypothetical protein
MKMKIEMDVDLLEDKVQKMLDRTVKEVPLYHLKELRNYNNKILDPALGYEETMVYLKQFDTKIVDMMKNGYYMRYFIALSDSYHKQVGDE